MSMYPLLVLFIYSVAMLSFCRITCYSAEQERRAIGRLFCMCRPRHNRTPEQGQEGDGVGGGRGVPDHATSATPLHFLARVCWLFMAAIRLKHLTITLGTAWMPVNNWLEKSAVSLWSVIDNPRYINIPGAVSQVYKKIFKFQIVSIGKISLIFIWENELLYLICKYVICWHLNTDKYLCWTIKRLITVRCLHLPSTLMTWHCSPHHIHGIALIKVYLSRKQGVYEPGTDGGNYWKCQHAHTWGRSTSLVIVNLITKLRKT